MKIAIISKSNKKGGGASRIAQEINLLLNKCGYESCHYHSGKIDVDDYAKPLYWHFQWMFRKAYGFFRKIGISSLIPLELPFLMLAVKKEKYDILHFHDISSAISPLTLLYFAKKIPIVWTVHDCSVFTGGCLYPMECNRYQTNCHPCPQRGKWPIDSIVDSMFIDRWLKKKLHASNNVTLVAPSQWMSDMAMTSQMISIRPTVLSNGVDTEVYKPLPMDRIDKIKAELGIKQGQTVYLVIAMNIYDERKGMSYAFEVLQTLKSTDPFVIVVGNASADIDAKLEGVCCFMTGFLDNESDLNEYYAIADIFLNCTLADNQPLVILEAMAAGTSVVGFKTGGIPEMVIENKTGFLVEKRDIDALVTILKEVNEDKRYIRWGYEARKMVEEKYTMDIFVNNHLHLYAALLKGEDEKAH